MTRLNAHLSRPCRAFGSDASQVAAGAFLACALGLAPGVGGRPTIPRSPDLIITAAMWRHCAAARSDCPQPSGDKKAACQGGLVLTAAAVRAFDGLMKETTDGTLGD
jgi:hypothetical protein